MSFYLKEEIYTKLEEKKNSEWKLNYIHVNKIVIFHIIKLERVSRILTNSKQITKRSNSHIIDIFLFFFFGGKFKNFNLDFNYKWVWNMNELCVEFNKIMLNFLKTETQIIIMQLTSDKLTRKTNSNWHS